MLTSELLAIAQALGLAQGETIDATWFSDPLTRLRGILAQPSQRAALFDLLDQIAPPANVLGTAATVKWHPLLGDRADGNLFLTVDTSGPETVFGVGARYAGAAASLLIDLPLCSLNGSTVMVVAGSEAAPFTVTLSVPLGWTRPAHSIALAAIEISVTLTSAVVTLQGLDVDGDPELPMRVFDPADLGAQSTRLLLGFLREQLHALPGPIANVVPLLGLDGLTPPFPFATIASDSRGLAAWLRAMTTGSPPTIGAWLGHLAGLLGVASPSVTTGSGGATNWTVPLFAPNATSNVLLTLATATAADTVTPLLEIGLALGLVPTGIAPVRVDIAVTLLSIPLAGTSGPGAFTNADISVSAPADQSQSLIAASPGAALSIDSVRAGLAWNGSAIAPLIELRNVAIADIGAFPIVDLHNALTVAGQAATDALIAGIKSALSGSPTGQHLAALAGLLKPASDSAAPLADVTQLVTHPTRTIAALHRAALLSSTHSWKAYFDEIVGLMGLAGSSTGTGTVADPWTVTIVQAAPAAFELVAWNAQTSGHASDPQQLRVGLRLAATVAPFTAALSLDLLGADLAADGTTTFSLIGAFGASVTFVPPAMDPINGVALAATLVAASARVTFGQPPSVAATIAGLSVTTPTGTIAIPSVTYPFAGGFDVTNPTAALGIGVAALEQLVQALLVHAVRARLGPTGVGLATALGCSGIDGLANDSPAATGLFTDPLAALRSWVSKVGVGLSADGTDLITPIVNWLGAALSTALAGPFPTPAPSLLAGSGTYDDPWRLPIGAIDSPAAATLWLDPDGPPGVPANVAADMQAIDNFWTLATAIADASLYVPSIPDGVDVDGLGTGLQLLSDFLAATDGVVPVASQIPTGGTWTAGTPIGAAHSKQPGDPSACAQILAAIDGWAPFGTTRAVLLLGPAFSDHTTWNTLLTQAEAAHPGTTNASATFNLRVSGVEPAAIDLRPVTVVADFYSADLQDDGTNDVAGLASQIGLVVERILELKPGAAIVLGAHSTAGIAARAYAAANAAVVKGLATLGTPHAGAPIEPLTDPTYGDPLRVYTHLLPTGVATGPVADALTHLQAALDGYLPGTAGSLPTPWPYPIADFVGVGSTDTGGVPALALGGPLGGTDGVDLLNTFATALAGAVNAVTRETPTHLGYGLRVDVPLGADGAVAAGADMRLDLGRLALAPDVADPARPAQALTTEISLARPGGWLAGGPLSYGGSGQQVSDVRVRSAQLGVTLTRATTGVLIATPVARLHEVAHHGTTTDLVTWGQPLLEAGLGAVFQAITAPAPDPASSLGGVLGALRALGLLTTDASGTIGISADAITGLSADPLGLLAPRMSAALAASGIPGFLAIDGSSYQLTLPSLPIVAVVALDPPSIALRTVDASGGVSITDGVGLEFSATLPLTTMTPAVTGSLIIGPATLTVGAGSLSLALPPAIPALSLYPPPSAAAARAAFTAALPRLIIDTVASALVQSALGPTFDVSDVLSLLENPGAWFVGPDALGDGTALDPAKLNALFQSFGTLPGGVTLSATGASPTTIALATPQPFGGLVSLVASLSVDHNRHCTPSGTITVQAPSGPGLTLGIGTGGVSLVAATGGASPTTIHLLPTFDGAAALAGAAKKLLPSALDALLAAVAPPATIVTLTLDVATALGLYDTVGGFSAHASQLAAMIDGDWFASISAMTRTQFLTAVTNYFNDPSSPLAGALPGSFAVAGSTIVWMYPLPTAVATGTLSLALGWDGSGPTVMLAADSVALAGAPITTSLNAGFTSGSLAADVSLALDLSSSLDVPVAPELVMTLGGSGVSLTFIPLGAGTATTLAIPIAPPGPIVSSGDAPMRLLTGWVIPLAANMLLGAVGSELATPLWNGGPTAAALLTTAGLITGSAGPPASYRLVMPIAFSTLAGNVLRGLGAVSVQIATNPALSLGFVSNGGQLGLRLLGSLPLNPDGSPVFSLLFGQPATWLGTNAGVTLYLFSTNSGLAFAPALDVRGLGVGAANTDGSPILDVDGFRIGSADGYLAFNVALTPALSVSDVGGGIEIDKLGLPLTALDQGTSANPVAASLLSSGSQSTSGDGQAANPSVDVVAYYLDGAFGITLAGQTQPVTIPVHANLGPLYIDQLELALDGTTAVEIGVDGNLAIDGLNVAVDELALRIPFDSVLTPAHWTLDLQGLSVGFSADSIGISGGLRKNPGPPIEYDGTLSVTMPGIGFGILAAYGRPTDALGAYTSLFMFVAYSQALGGPPFAFVTGLGGGFGYNRLLQLPTDFNQIPSFPLIEAIDGGIANDDPLAAFAQMATLIAPRRGSFWLAAGVRFTSFALINTTAIVAVAIDRGFVIDVLGVSRMALPSESAALASVELAIKARYDNQAETLQVQAQLTDNSYLFSRDCQLTGGFALFVWFQNWQAVLTLGGYNPAFTVPPNFPVVPRLGFSWAVDSDVVVKGNAYFALTDSCVMAGGALSLTGSYGAVSAWFDAAINMLVSWDPFAYEFDISVDIGASATFQVCFIECATINVSISVGAKLAIAGPPFHGSVTIDVYVTSVTISFGHAPQSQNYITDWGTFAGKYLTAGDANGTAVSLQVGNGLLVSSATNTQAEAGSQAAPWPMGVEFTLVTTTRMPANQTMVPVTGINALDIAPMDALAIASTHILIIEQLPPGGTPIPFAITGAPDNWAIAPRLSGFPEATWHWVDPKHIPAGARTISAIAGLTVDAKASCNDPSALLPVAGWVVDLPQHARPLPFATTAAVTPVLTGYGGDADAMAALVATATASQALAASAKVLTGNGVFAAGRSAVGLSARGLAPLAAAALATARSAPPLITPIATGLTMKPVGLVAATVPVSIAPTAPVLLATPRLRAVLSSPTQSIIDAPTSVHTTVQSKAPRMRAPVPSVMPGARLIIVQAAQAPRPTTAAIRPRALRNADFGAAIGQPHQNALTKAATDLGGGGVTLGAGTMHLWDLPNAGGRLTLRGGVAARVLCLDRRGTVLSDVELIATPTGAQLGIAPGTEMIGVACLGAMPADVKPVAISGGAVTTRYTNAGANAAVGWQSTSMVAQIGPSSFAARGATVRVIRAGSTQRNAQRASVGVALAADVFRDQVGIETRLPVGLGVVIVVLDAAESLAGSQDDLSIGVEGARLGTPVRVLVGARRLVLYDVLAPDPKALALTVAVASAAAWHVSAVIGVLGTSAQWAATFAAGIPDGFVSDAPLAPNGALTMTYVAGAAA